MKLRPWEGLSDTAAAQRLASWLWPHGLHPGGLGWAAAIGQLADRLVLIEDGGMVGWAGFSPGALTLQVDPSRPDAADAAMDWALEASGPEALTLAIADGDDTVRAAATRAGFVPQEGALPGRAMQRTVTGAAPRLASGYSIRSVGDTEHDARVEVHRAAWRPASLPWPPGDRPPIPEDATSTFTAEHYDLVRQTWLYDQSLDLVVVAPDGTLAACCIVWWDPAIGCAEIEPLGVVPAHRRRGLAGALCLEVAVQVATRGGHTVFINTSPDIEYSTPATTYASVGFEVVRRDQPYLRLPS
jgi:GNAT superfamily N-acetyltransferase